MALGMGDVHEWETGNEKKEKKEKEKLEISFQLNYNQIYAKINGKMQNRK